MILEVFRKKSTHFELVWGRKTNYKFYSKIKKKNYICPAILIELHEWTVEVHY
jgi:hypothetical protein